MRDPARLPGTCARVAEPKSVRVRARNRMLVAAHQNTERRSPLPALREASLLDQRSECATRLTLGDQLVSVCSLTKWLRHLELAHLPHFRRPDGRSERTRQVLFHLVGRIELSSQDAARGFRRGMGLASGEVVLERKQW